jgi:hypothetical protein
MTRTSRTGNVRALLAGATVAGCFATSAPAHAQADESCIAASESAVVLQGKSSLVEARQQLASCAAPACPDPVRTSCQERLEQINRRLPSVIFDVKDGQGADIGEFRLSIDGTPSAGDVRGAAISLNPGGHEFRFEVAGQEPVVKRFVLHEGEQYRRELIVVGPVPAAPPAAATPPPQSAPATSLMLAPGTQLHVTGGEKARSEGSFQRTMGTLLLAVGLPVGAIATLTYGGIALGKWNNAQNECNPGACGSQAQNDLHDARSAATTSTILTVVTGVALVGGIVLRATARSGRSTPPTVVPVVGSAGGGLVLQGGFP